MPHACRRCFVPYGLRFEEIFGDFWSPCSICESRTHTTSTKGKCMKMHENQRFFRKSKSLTCPPSLPSTDHTNIGKNQAQTCSAVAMSRRSAELEPGNLRSSPKSPKNSPKSPLMGRRMSPALTDRPGIRKNLSHTCIGKQHWDVCA